LLALFFVSPAIFWASGREVYPSVNPDSGGATGASLLASTLGITAIYGLLPIMLRHPSRSTTSIARRVFWSGLAVSSIACLLIDHGHASHHSIGQILGLGLLLGWVPLAWHYFRGFSWTSTAQRWLAAAFAWWVILVISGFLFFLPGISERLKFTNTLVAHAHLALAGLVTCFNGAILNLLNPGQPITRGFRLWQFALALHIAALVCVGWTESRDPGALFLSQGWTQALYGLRLAAGIVMWALSAVWFLNRPQASASND
jgi:cytochrome c oxidase cbb3-type subunit 1